MQNVQPNLFTRGDTFFGVCEGLGEDLRIHPNLLRLALAGLLFWSPVAAGAAYLIAGAVVALSRWIAPAPVATTAALCQPALAETDQQSADMETEAESIRELEPLAA